MFLGSAPWATAAARGAAWAQALADEGMHAVSFCMHYHHHTVPRASDASGAAETMAAFDAEGRRLEPLPANWSLPPWVDGGFVRWVGAAARLTLPFQHRVCRVRAGGGYPPPNRSSQRLEPALRLSQWQFLTQLGRKLGGHTWFPPTTVGAMAWSAGGQD